MAAPQGQPMMAPPPLQPGQQPTPEQIQAMQRQIAAEAQKAGMSVQQYVEQLKAQAMRQHQAQQQMRMQQAQQQGMQQQQQQQQPQQGQQQPITPGPPKPEAIAVANYLRNQDLKTRTCIFQEKRKDMFKVKRAIRALQTPAYAKARSKNPLLPEVNDRVSAENTFKLLPLSLLALRVSKIDEHEGHNHAKKKRVKGLWTVKVEQQQEARDEFHYVWLYEGPQWKQKLYAAGALALIMIIVLFPLWPIKLRIGVWYLSMGSLGVLGLFFAMAFFRLILFVVTMFATPPGLWLYPNLFEDVGFFDSFKPLWGWQETAEDKKNAKAAAKAKKQARMNKKGNGNASEDGSINKADISAPVGVSTNGPGASGSEPAGEQTDLQRRNMTARVEEVEDDD